MGFLFQFIVFMLVLQSLFAKLAHDRILDRDPGSLQLGNLVGKLRKILLMQIGRAHV